MWASNSAKSVLLMFTNVKIIQYFLFIIYFYFYKILLSVILIIYWTGVGPRHVDSKTFPGKADV